MQIIENDHLTDLECDPGQSIDLVEAHLASRSVQRRVLTVCSCVGLLGVGILSVCLAVGQGAALDAGYTVGAVTRGDQI